MNTKVYGLCGRSGSGKNACGEIIARMGIPVIDSDEVYRRLTEEKGGPLLAELSAYFGEEIIKADGTLDRKKLAALAFSTEEKHSKLGEITHKYIRKRIEKLITDSENDSLVLLAPLLFESGADSLCDEIICVIADDDECKKRIMERDGLTEREAVQRLSHQYTNEFLIARCGYVIHNNGSFSDLEEKISELFGDCS